MIRRKLAVAVTVCAAGGCVYGVSVGTSSGASYPTPKPPSPAPAPAPAPAPKPAPAPAPAPRPAPKPAPKPKVCTVPLLNGRALSGSETALTSANCAVGAITTAYSAMVPAPDVITSVPGPGTYPVGTKVAISVSIGAQGTNLKCTVPKNLPGEVEGTAENALVRNRCGIGAITMKASGTVAKGDVISSTPAGPKSEKVGFKVKLAVSNGKPKATKKKTKKTTKKKSTQKSTKKSTKKNAATKKKAAAKK